MADDDRRAEIEAVARELHARLAHLYSFAACESFAVPAITALDRVRDARGDDEEAAVKALVAHLVRRYGAVQSEETEEQAADLVRVVLAALSPQGEDHETARPEQPAPDTLGGQPPAEPPEAP